MNGKANDMKTVQVSPARLAMCVIKAEHAEDMSRAETKALMSWCDNQAAVLWEFLSLQEILNVYHATAEWGTFDAWAAVDWKAAYAAWDKAIIAPRNNTATQHLTSIEELS